MTLLNPRVDVAFKLLFGSEKNKDLLISFINAVVSAEHQVVSVELLNPYNSRNFAKDKNSILDIKARDCEGKYFNIEMQISDEGNYDKRALFYWSKLYADQLQGGNAFSALDRAIGIHVLNFTCIPGNDNYCNKWVIKEDRSHQHFFKDFAIYTIELNKFIGKEDTPIAVLLPQIRTSLDRWSLFLTRAVQLHQGKLPKEMDDPYIRKAFGVLETASLTPRARSRYEDHLKWLRIETSVVEKVARDSHRFGHEIGVKEGQEIGIQKGRREMVIQMMQSGLSKEQICSTTSWSADQ